jgi:hypothetical protein
MQLRRKNMIIDIHTRETSSPVSYRVNVRHQENTTNKQTKQKQTNKQTKETK